jgi:hypothetical protein
MRLYSQTSVKYDLPIPEPFGDEWEISEHSRRPRLTQNAFKELRSAIRTERKERSELARGWLSSIAGMIGVATGLIGALIGLLAVVRGRQ